MNTADHGENLLRNLHIRNEEGSLTNSTIDNPDYRPLSSEEFMSSSTTSSTTSDTEGGWSPVPKHRVKELAAQRRLSTETASSMQQPIAATIPSELLLEILKLLPNHKDLHSAILTCHSWCICGVELLWYKPSFYTSTALVRLLPVLRRDGVSFDYPSFIRRLNLSYLCEYVTDSALMKLQRCKKLERLTLVNCRRITDRGLCDILSRNTGLVALDVSGLSSITDLSIHVASSRNKNMQGLNLTDCASITDDAIINIANTCLNLRRLKLNNCVEIRDRSINAIASKSRYLLEIDLEYCCHVTSTAVANLITQCRELRELRLNMCPQISDECFVHLERDAYVNMRCLDLTGCSRITDDSVYHIVTAAPKLRTLVLAKCPNITDRGAVQIARLGKHLHFLHLGHCNQLTNRCVAFLAKYCNRLRYIDLACCTQLTDEAVIELNGLPRLKRIGLVKCSAITPHAIYALTRQGVVQYTLERIHLSYCNNLQLDCIRDLLNACKRLTHISLTGVPAFLRTDLTQFCRPAPNEFSAVQAAVFCVFSGSGVIKLRHFLNERYKDSARFNEITNPEIGLDPDFQDDSVAMNDLDEDDEDEMDEQLDDQF